MWDFSADIKFKRTEIGLRFQLFGNLDSASLSGLTGLCRFFLNVAENEMQTRMENSRKRRFRDPKFSLLKPLGVFKFEVAPQSDSLLINELSTFQYVDRGAM